MASEIAIGQLFVIGYPEVDPSHEFLDFLRTEQIGGVILFADNCSDANRLHDNIDHIARLFPEESKPLIAIDQEGGRVCRLRGNPAEYGAAADYGDDGDIEGFTRDYRAAARHMVELGINLNLAPVADLTLAADNTCLDGRCFGREGDVVSSFVARSVAIAHECELLCCLKHFPGLGAAEIDPHLAMATADYDESIWYSRERGPFQAGIDAGVDLVMTTHLQLPRVEERLATGSRRIVTDWLRQGLGFEGAVVTDDLCMQGATALGTPGERCLAALDAGHDLLLFGQDFTAVRQAYDELRSFVSDGRVNGDRIASAGARVAALKLKLDGGVRTG